MTTLRIPGALQPLAGGAAELNIAAPTVGDALGALVERYPALRRHLYDEQGAIRGFVNVYLNEEDVRHLHGVQTTLADHDVITIVPSVAGGNDPPFTVDELGRYSRHIALAEVGLASQLRLKNAKVLIVGAGGLGSPAGLAHPRARSPRASPSSGASPTSSPRARA